MNKTKIYKKQILIWNSICFVFLVTLDRMAKIGAVRYCEYNNYTILSDILEITCIKNPGGIMGSLKEQKIFFIFIVAFFSCLILFFLCVLPKQKKFFSFHICLTCILAGSLGNLADRILYGYVIDYIYIRKISDFPIFNFSDVWISFGTVCMLFLLIFHFKEKDFDFLNFKQNKYREIK